MASPDKHVKNIVLVGASGNIGAQVLKHLLEAGRFNVSVVSRTDSDATFPEHSSLTIKRGSYSDPSFLASALRGQDALVLALGFMAMDAQTRIIEAAVSAGVPWILPTEYANDQLNDAMVDAVPLFAPKRQARQHIEQLSAERNGEKTKWIGVATNPWVPFSVQTGMFGIDPFKRTATLYEDAGPFNVSTLEQAGKAITALLSLPIEDGAQPRASLQHYANNFLYVSSALTTQRELFAAALKATGTKQEEWETNGSSCRERLRVAQEAIAKGDWRGGAEGVYAVYMGEGMGGDYEAKAREDREVLGLREESVEEIVRTGVDLGPFSVM